MAKPFLTYEQQIAHLSSKHMIINNPQFAKQMLMEIGYFSLIVAYKHSFKNPTTKNYRDDVTFEDVVMLYRFDEELRHAFLKPLLAFERTLKTQLAYVFCDRYGDSQNEYLNHANYDYVPKKQRSIDKLINQFLQPLALVSKDYPYINHHRDTHGNVPLWVLINALTFGNASRMFENLPQSLQSAICKNYVLRPHEMASILSVITKFRNTCAHGERLFELKTKDAIPDLSLHNKLQIRKKGTEYMYGKRDLFSLVIALRYLLSKESYSQLIRKISELIATFTAACEIIDQSDLLRRMGFPSNWKMITRYKL